MPGRILLWIGLLLPSASCLGDQNADQVFLYRLVDAALQRTTHQVTYDGSYYAIAYPNGDVPSHLGVCTDVVIRSYRSAGIDLQRAVHEDISGNFEAYPSRRIWGMNKPDPNIDHRRVPNLRTFLERHGETIPVTADAADYAAGDLVTWLLPGNLPHIGIVTDRRSVNGERPLIVHNVGAGPKLEDVLFNYAITGHYRYTGR